MPMDMRKLIPEEFVVHLLRVMNVGRDRGHSVDLLDQLKAFSRCELEQLSGMALEDHDGPPGEELVIVEVDLGRSEVCNKMILSRPSSLAGFTRGVRHGWWFALRHSSSVNTPFLIRS